MPVPQQRNQKKTKHRRNTGHTIRQRRFLLDEPRPSFEDWLLEQRNPGDWIENECLEEGTFEDRMLALAERKNRFYERPRSFLDLDENYDPDIGNDLYGIADIEDIEDFI
jgi:hypothetical protein